MHFHFIAIGGSAMHNLAIALHQKGHLVTGSDDEIFDPAKQRLQRFGLLPKHVGWNPDMITSKIDAVVLGMHARKDNPELQKAKELGIRVYSYPEFLYEESKNKTRVVIGGSHGKTTITAMILHVLHSVGMACDYMVGAQLEGFEVMVKLSDSCPVIIMEGDEYLTSPMDPRPKFHVYKPHIALISGIAWDHINVFPTFDIYKEQFSRFASLIEPHGRLIYCAADDEVRKIGEQARPDIQAIAYHLPEHRIEEGKTYLLHENQSYLLQVFGEHNLLNVAGAWRVCEALGVSDQAFLSAIMHFRGANKRLEKVGENETVAMYKDFAHSPSKLQATVKAMKSQYPTRKLVACMELHTFSSLTADFLQQYAGCMDDADEAIVYFNPQTIAHKKLNPISAQDVQRAFANTHLTVYNSAQELAEYLKKQAWHHRNLLLMSSGNFDGMCFEQLAKAIL